LILDTNALSAFADGYPEAVAAVGKVDRVAIPVIVIGEYRYGIAQSHRRLKYEDWLTGFLAACDGLDITVDTALEYAAIQLALRRAGTPIPSNDIWIAALCRQHHLPLLSRDRHFDRIQGLRRLAW
jgi:predicted nucleic acid-binding protein